MRMAAGSFTFTKISMRKSSKVEFFYEVKNAHIPLINSSQKMYAYVKTYPEKKHSPGEFGLLIGKRGSMTYLTNGIQTRLQQAFIENNLSLQSDYVIIENSQNQTEEKIRRLITSVSFCPLISSNKINGNFAFTIVPYKIPDFFLAKEKPCDKFSDLKCVEKQDSTYFNLNEIAHLLEQKVFIDQDQGLPKDIMHEVNNFRSCVLPALNKGLSALISQYARDEYPIVEIGSNIGYTFPEDLSSRIIRIQPDKAACQLLRQSISDPIYQTDIEGLCDTLKGKKKIPLFFALHMFDNMSSQRRKISFSQLSQLQNAGDYILILLDNNPSLYETVQLLKDLYPGHTVLPYFPLTNDYDYTKLSVIIVPFESFPFAPSVDALAEMINAECMLLASGRASPLQHKLHLLQKKYNLKVIELEDFFAEQVQKELEQTGYKADIYYYASFATGELPQGISDPSKLNKPLTEDLLYKPVTDTSSLRQWSVTDQNLLNRLDKKGLALPSYINAVFLKNLREKRQKIFGAEFLVIEATKQG
jgi:hypothetical protein